MNARVNPVLLQRAGSPKAAHARSMSFPAPVGGWNARDSIAEMDALDALAMVNFFPGQGRVTTRLGQSSYATGLGGWVETLVEFYAGANRKFLAAANGNLWDISAAGAAVSLKSGFISNRWQTAQFDDQTGGARLGLVNGADAPQIYTPAGGIAAMTVSGTGLTVSNLIGIQVYASRSYFFDQSRGFWYSAVGALGGTLSYFALGAAINFAGNIVRAATWTLDGGQNSLVSFICFFSDAGDVIIYGGTDPSNAANFYLVGVFRIGAPLGMRFTTPFGKDIAVVTKEGFLPLSRVKGMSQLYGKNTLSDKIKPAVISAAALNGAQYGWECVLYPEHSLGSMILFNVPLGNQQYAQYVMNADTGAWAQFSGWNGETFALYKDQLYIGGNGAVVLCDTGYSDAGNPIGALCQSAWNYLKSPGLSKKINLIRPNFISTLPGLTVSVGLGVDFGPIGQQVTTVTTAPKASPWNTSPWNTSPWSSENVAQSVWHDVGAEGRALSVQLQVSATQVGLEWMATDYLFEAGGML